MRTNKTACGRRAGLGSLVLISGCLLAASCSSSAKTPVSTGAGTTAPAGTSTATVMVRSTKLGSVLTDASGKTLYTFDSDKAGATTSACTGGCASAWPPLTATGTPTAGPGVSGTLATISGGQVTWDGHPLYRWMNDHAPGDVTGDGVNGFHVAIVGGATSTTSGSGTGSGY